MTGRSWKRSSWPPDDWRAAGGGTAPAPAGWGAMTEKEVYSDPSDVKATGGAVSVEGPDAVDVQMTPEAAEETAERLSDQAVVARGQRRLRNIPHKPGGPQA